MEALLRDDLVLQVLRTPWDWKVISSLFPSDVPPAADARLKRVLMEEAERRRRSAPGISICLRGEGFVLLDSQIYRFDPGTCVLADLGELTEHLFDDPSQKSDVLMIGVFRGWLYSCFWSIDGGEPFPTPEGGIPLPETELGISLERLWRSLKRHSGQPNPPTPSLRTRLLAGVSLATAAVLDACERPQPRFHERIHAQAVEAIRRHVADNLQHGANLDALARLAGYSRYHFARIFREHTGQSIHEYLDECRLARLQSLQARGYSQKQIALELGFSGPTVLSAWRRKQRERGSAL